MKLPRIPFVLLASLLFALLPCGAMAQTKALEKAREKALASKGFWVWRPLWGLREYYQDQLHPFYTADALLRVYRRLYEEGMARLAWVQQRELLQSLRGLWRELRKGGEPSGISGFLVGGALGLLQGKLPEGGRPELRKELESWLKKVKTGRGHGYPRYWGAGDQRFSGVEFVLFRPQGFYVEDPEMSRLFRAVRWLMLLPLRMDQEEERRAMLRLREVFLQLDPTERGGLRFAKEIFGEPKDWDLVLASRLSPSLWDKQWRQRREGRKAKGKAEGTPMFRILSGARTADQGYLDRKWTEERKKDPSVLPSATWLLDPIRNRALGEESGSLHDHLLYCLGRLLQPADARAPLVFRRREWGREKEKQTVLSGWVQARHGMVLQEEPLVESRGVVRDPFQCYIEPYPGFFHSFARLCFKAGRRLSLSPKWGRQIARMEFRMKVKRLQDPEKVRLFLEKMRTRDEVNLEKAFLKLGDLSERFGRWSAMELAGEAFDAKDIKALRGEVPRVIAELYWFGVHDWSPYSLKTRIVYQLAYDARQGVFVLDGIEGERELWVKLPLGGREVILKGYVLHFAEIHSKHPMTDADWRKRK